MAISEDAPKSGSSVNYKQMYRNLKRKLKILITENECFKSELRRAQGQFLQVERDNNYLLERLMQHENCDPLSSDSGATDSSDEEPETSPDPPVRSEPQNAKRKKAAEPVPTNDTGQATAPTSSKKRRSASASSAPNTRTASTNSPRNQSKTAIRINLTSKSCTVPQAGASVGDPNKGSDQVPQTPTSAPPHPVRLSSSSPYFGSKDLSVMPPIAPQTQPPAAGVLINSAGSIDEGNRTTSQLFTSVTDTGSCSSQEISRSASFPLTQ